MAKRIEIQLKITDSRAETLKKSLNLEYGNIIENLSILDVYTLEKNLSENEFEKIKKLIANEIVENISYGKPIEQNFNFDFALEIGFLPGVTDNVGKTANQVIKDAVKFDTEVYSSKLYYLKGNLNKDRVEKIANYLGNNLIQKISIKSFSEFKKDNGMDIITPKVKLNSKNKADIVEILNLNDDELLEIGKNGIIDPITKIARGPLALDLDSMKIIQKYFKSLNRNPFDIELEAIAQTWSEHCKHTIFAAKIDDLNEGLYKGYIKKATNEIRKLNGKDDFCVSVFTDNSGVIKFDDNYLITDKAETHNSPSALDPFGGAITGIVGVNRDTIGCAMGAMPIVNTFGFCLADPKSKPELYRGKNKTNPALSPFKIMQGVVKGVNEGGNCSGIPTAQGFMNFHEDFRGKPLVFVRTIGLIPKTINGKDSTLKKAKSGDFIVVVGGRVGKDGVHGATFSSVAMDSKSPVSAVQIGDPITQKKLSDAIIKEARDKGLYNSITDNGAGGISCSVAEMAKECNGCEVNLDKVPLKYTGMAPWEIWVSESQERMTLSIPENKWKEFNELMTARGVEATIIGKFTSTGKCIVKQNDETIMDISLEFLHDGLSLKALKSSYTQKKFEEPSLENISIQTSLSEMIKELNICSTEFVFRQYDHEVGAGSVLKPIVGVGEIVSETSIVRPIFDSKKSIGISQALFPKYGEINPYHMAACAIDSSIKNLVASGIPFGKIALMDNFCWCSSYEEQRLGELKLAVKACYDFAVQYKAPFISGKDSMFNDFKGFDKDNNPVKISAPPTILISSIGVMDNFEKSVSLDLKFENDLIYIIGETKSELGGSEFYNYLGNKQTGKRYVGNNVPIVNAKENIEIYKKLTLAIENDLISSSIPVNSGGVGVSIMKTSIAADLGVEIDLNKIPTDKKLTDLETLFSESTGRIIVSINPLKQNEFEKIMTGVKFAKIGYVTKSKTIKIKGKENILLNIDQLKNEYKSTLGGY